MVPTLEWVEGFSEEPQKRDVSSVDELDRTLDELTDRAKLSMPFNVVLAHTDATTMDIVLGADLAFIGWTGVDPWSCLAGADEQGNSQDDRLVVFAGNGQWSELPRSLGIDVPTARAVMRHYFATGGLAPFVRWVAV
jgi:hypothetical protein